MCKIWAIGFFLSVCLISPVFLDIVSVIYDENVKAYQIINGTTEKYVAWANFSDRINETGWAFLEIVTNGSYDDIQQAYAAGLAEGFLTTELLYNHWMNTVDGYCNDEQEYCNNLRKFLNDNLDWTRSQIKTYGDSVPYWHQVKLVFEQLVGLQDGYSHQYEHDVLKDDSLGFGFLMFQIGGDLEDLESVLKKKVEKRVLGSGSCSALIKLLPGNKDLFVAHDSWSTYQSMLRILKKYTFNYHYLPDKESGLVPGFVASFSSYPGSLGSGDDYFLLSSSLVTLETTIGNGNSSLWKYVKPQSVLEWVRTLVANRLAMSGRQWSVLFTKYNSGTYNNQWMVVDYKQFSPNMPVLKPGLLWIVEQLPGFTRTADKTSLLAKQTYWPSYNVPYFEEIFNLSGGPENVKRYGDWFTYDKTPRALIFQRDHEKVVDMRSFIKLMRYNDYQHDPLSKCNCTPPYSAENAISARNDLNPANGTYPFGALGHRSHGGIDMKATGWKWMANLEFVAIGGPTYDQLPPFQWSQTDFGTSTPHLGHPDIWQFGPVLASWQ